MDPFETFRTGTRVRIGAEAQPWLDRLPGYLDGVRDRWGLELDEPVGTGATGYTVAATRSGEDGAAEDAVLKLSYPDAWFVESTAALARWNGDGAVRLLAHDPDGAQLLERAEPGSSLLDKRDEDGALSIAADVLQRLWVPDPGGIMTVESETAEWARTMPGRYHLVGRPFERSLVTEALDAFRELGPTQPERVLLHGDLHMGNVLAAERQPWLAIDPKPLIGERAFDVTALLRDKAPDLIDDPAAGRERLQHRFDLLSERLGLDRPRLRQWSLAVLVDYAIWDFEVGDTTFGEQQAEVARMIRRLIV